MPSVNIREIDNTGSETLEYVENIVLTPALKIERKHTDKTVISLDGQYNTFTQFKNALKAIFAGIEKDADKPADISAEEFERLKNLKSIYYTDQGYVLAATISSSGLPIQYYGAYGIETVTVTEDLESGEVSEKTITRYTPFIIGKPFTDGQKDTNGKYTTLPTKATGLYKFADRGRYDIRFITVGPLSTDLTYKYAAEDKEEKTFVDACQAIIDVAARRGDAYALLAHPDEVKAFQSTYLPSDENYSVAVDRWIDDNFADYCNTLAPEDSRNGYTWNYANENQEKLGNYAAMFTPNLIMSLALSDGITSFKLSKDGNKNKVIPAYLQYLLAYKSSSLKNPTWFAIAGATRGTSNATIVPQAEYGDVDIDILQTRKPENKGHISCNAIYWLRGTGYTLWGNRTMHPLNIPNNAESDVAQLTASDFLNIRSLACDLKKTIYRSCRRHTFDPNSDNLWFAFKSEITPILEKMKANQGCRDYRIIRITTNKKAVLAARIQVNPIEGVEDFDVTIEFTDTVDVE